MINKHEIPILEFDDCPQAVIMPTHENLDLNLPARCVYAFLEEEIECYANAVGAEKVGEFVSSTKTYPVYVMTYNGEEICLAQAPSWLSCSCTIYGLANWLWCKENHFNWNLWRFGKHEGKCFFLIPTRALRDEGASYHYVAPSRYIDMNKQALEAIEKTLKQKKIPYEEVMTWSTDGFYRETPDKVSYRIEEGCRVVEMECSALAAVAQLRGVIWGLLLFTADSLCRY